MCEDCKLEVIIKVADELARDKEVFGSSFVKHMGKMMKQIRKYFDIKYQEGLKVLDNNLLITKELNEDILKSEDRLKTMEDDLAQEYIDFFTIGAIVQEGLIQHELTVGIQFAIKDQLAKQYAIEHAAELIGGLDKIAKDEINNILNEAMDNMLSQSEAADLLNEKFSQLNDWRAMLITRMEATNAYAYGSKTQFEQYTDHFSIQGRKRTQALMDGKTRSSHRNADEMGYVEKNTPYPDLDNDMGLSVQAAPFDFNCRCVTLYRLTNPNNGELQI